MNVGGNGELFFKKIAKNLRMFKNLLKFASAKCLHFTVNIALRDNSF